MDKQIPELEKELITGKCYLYNCGHLPDGPYPQYGMLPVGPYANLIVCKHCWQNLRNIMLVSFFEDLLKHDIDEPLRVLLTALTIQAKDTTDA